MNVVIEYLPDADPKKTEKMIDDLRVLGMEDLRVSMLQNPPSNKKTRKFEN